MILPTWLNRFRKPAPAPKGKFCCDDCGIPIHRHDRYIILIARHKSSAGPKLVGQKSLEVEQ